jgi:hypothetical protein
MGTFDKAKAKTTAKPKKKWWIINTNRYSYYIWALPFIPFIELSDKIKEYRSKRRVWNKEKATKILMLIASALTVAAAGLSIAIGILGVIRSAKPCDCCEPEIDPFCE